MVEGVTKGFQKKLEISGVGYKAETKPYGVLLVARLLAPDRVQGAGRASSSRRRGRHGRESRARTRNWSARWPRRSAACASPSRTRARASSTRVSRSAGRPARREASNARRFDLRRRAQTARYRRHLRVRKTVDGTAERPRLVVFRSLKHIYAQIVDDDERRDADDASPTRARRRRRREQVAPARSASCSPRRRRRPASSKVVFDRAGYQYHGRVKAVADGAREGGLEF